jgi:hypothetical protein
MKQRFWGGVEAVNRALEKWAAENDLNFSLIDPTEYSAPAGFPLGERVTPDGSAWWSTADPVHLSQDSYRALASAIMGLQSAEDEAPSTVGSGSSAAIDKGRESPPPPVKEREWTPWLFQCLSDPPEGERYNAQPCSVEALTATAWAGVVAMDTGAGILTGVAPRDPGQGAGTVVAVANGTGEVNLLQLE